MYKRFGILLMAVMILTALFVTGCKEPSSSSPPKVTISISFIPGNYYVVKGEFASFEVDVHASDNKDPGGVTWDIIEPAGHKSSIAAVSADTYTGRLTVPADETVTNLKIRATSKRDTGVSASIDVRVEDTTPPQVASVSILLNGDDVTFETTQESVPYYVGDNPIHFSHLVVGDDGVSQEVNWSLGGQVNCGDPDCENDAAINDGLLTICDHEVVREVDVIVTSAIDTSKSATAKVRIGIKDKVFEIELFLDDGSEVQEDSSIEVLKGDTYQFTYDITAVEGFRNVDWVIDGSNCHVQSCEGTNIKDGSIPFSAVLTVCEHETAEEIKVTVKSRTDSAFFKSVSVTILSLPTVHSVAIKLPKDGSNNDIDKFYRGGSNYQFDLDIDADDDANEAVVWGIAGTADGVTVNGTTMSHGSLSVSLTETAKTITITAVSVLNPEASAQTVINISSPISMTISQSGHPFSAPGGSLSFHAAVAVVEGIVVSEHITWEVNSAVSQIHGTGPNAALEISASETAGTLTVSAKSDALPDVVSNSISITVVKDVRFATLSGSTWTYQTMSPQPGGAFTYRATVSGETEFRLNIGDGKWFVPVADGAKQQPNWGEEDIAYFDTATQRSWVLPVLGYYDITVTPHTMKMIVIPPNVAQLDTPAAPAFSEQGVAAWLAVNGDEHVTGYTIYLYQNNIRLEETRVNVTKGNPYTHNYLAVMREKGLGEYTVRVRANGNNFDSRDSEFSAQSVMREVKQRDTITALSWDGDKAKWTAKDSLQLGYKVILYRDRAQIKEYQTLYNELEKDFASDIGGKNGSYEFRVIALGADTSLVTDSEESVFSPAELKIYEVWLLNDRNSFALPGSPMVKEDGKFIWNKNLTETPFSGLWTTVIFSLSDTHDDLFVPVDQNSIDPAIGAAGNDMDRVSTKTGALGWRLPAGSYVFTLERASSTQWRMTVDKPVVVSGGELEFDHTMITRGGEYVFVPKLTGHNANDAVISWDVLPGTGSSPVLSAFGTGENDKNTLYVHADEANTSLIIVLSAADKDGKKEIDRTSAITVRNPPQYGDVTINLVIQDMGGGKFLLDVPQNLTMSKSGGGSITLSVSAQPGMSEVRWVVSNGTAPVSGNEITLNAANFGVGDYTVRLFATINGIPWSSDHIAFKVTQ